MIRGRDGREKVGLGKVLRSHDRMDPMVHGWDGSRYHGDILGGSHQRDGLA